MKLNSLNLQLIFSLLIVLVPLPGKSELKKHLRSDFGYEAKNSSIKNIDAIYLINLNHRPGKLNSVLQQLNPYNIIPYRFSAINGWALPLEIINNVGLIYGPGMAKGKWAQNFILRENHGTNLVLLDEEQYGKAVFSNHYFTPGAIGCSLSHLSVLKNALECGYNTIWVIEDDISVVKDPHVLADYIEKLDILIGKDNWDVLYTDMDELSRDAYASGNYSFLNIMKTEDFLWRPDIDFPDQRRFFTLKPLNQDFSRIGSRKQTHSMIIRRCGMEKILNHLNKHHLYPAYDDELALIPDIKLVNLNEDAITRGGTYSDTLHNFFSPEKQWKKHKANFFEKLSAIPSPKSIDSILVDKLMDFIREKNLDIVTIVDLENFALPLSIADSMSFKKHGALYLTKDPDISLWLKKFEVEPFCQYFRLSKFDETFKERSIDFLLLNSNAAANPVPHLNAVKPGGYILLCDTDKPENAEIVGYFVDRCEWLKNDATGISYLLLRKNPL